MKPYSGVGSLCARCGKQALYTSNVDRARVCGPCLSKQELARMEAAAGKRR